MSEDIKRKYQDQLGETFGAIFYGLEKHWVSGVLRLKEFRVLFSDAERVELLNAMTGGAFLWDVQQIFWDDLILRVTRLTDPVGFPTKENLTIRKLPRFCDDPALRSEVKQRVKAAIQATKSAREYRNRRIGHNDLTLELDAHSKPLVRASLHEVQVSLDSVHGILNVITRRLLGAEIANDVVISPRALAFVSNATQLAQAVQFIDSLIDPTGTAKFTDHAAASDFLKKLCQSPTWEKTRQAIELRQAASLFK